MKYGWAAGLMWTCILSAPGQTPPTSNSAAQAVPTPPVVQQSVTVTADRGLVGVQDAATSTVVLTGPARQAAPGLTLDDALHQTAGFQLFRRTSSWTANPTTEGVSLRGLGSTAASRTLVESDEVPLNDPFGGWIHWDEIPTLAVGDVVLVRGGAADLYGSSAVGGVIALTPVTAGADGRSHVAADGFGATENTGGADLLVNAASRLADLLLAGSGLATGGYLPTAPAQRGPVDAAANVSEQSGRLELRRSFAALQPPSGSPASSGAWRTTAFLRGNVLNESRQNGSLLQTNGTRLWRYAGGGDLDGGSTHAALRVFGDRETYRQSFSAINAIRSTETLTRLQQVPTDEFGFALSGSRPWGTAVVTALGVDMRDIRATDAETPVSGGASGVTTAISARQRAVGGYAEASWQLHGWSAAASIRADSFRTFDGRQRTEPSAVSVREPEVSELVASPHLGLVRQVRSGLALTANAFRAFRGPTMNELYRTGQVGQQTTLANPSLLAERATGIEFGGEFADLRIRGRSLGRLRASYFWTEVNRPVSTVLLSQTATAQTLQRQNLGQLRSRGLSLEAHTANWRGFSADAGWQLAVATVTRFNSSSALQANLVGKWLPQVPRNIATAAVHWTRPSIGSVHVFSSYTGRTYDDSANNFLLHPYARFDVSVERPLWSRLSVYGGVQNLLNRAIDAGRTPVLTLAAPRLVQAGLRWQFER